jgi:hypothetical protein
VSASGLFGIKRSFVEDLDQYARQAESPSENGVNEIDFGISARDVMASLRRLAALAAN